MKIIKLDYPKCSSALYYDGKTHIVVPSSLKQLTNGTQNYYLLTYLETDSRQERSTLLERNNNDFISVPLKVYDKVYEQLNEKFNTDGQPLDLALLPDYIKVTEPVLLIDYLQNQKSEYLVDIYYNEVDQKIYSDASCTREIFYNPNNALCYFEREAINPVVGNLDINSLQVQTVINYNVIPVQKKVESNVSVPPLKLNRVTETRTIYFNKLDFKYYEDPECTKQIEGAPLSLGEVVGSDTIVNPNGIMYSINEVRVAR